MCGARTLFRIHSSPTLSPHTVKWIYIAARIYTPFAFCYCYYYWCCCCFCCYHYWCLCSCCCCCCWCFVFSSFYVSFSFILLCQFYFMHNNSNTQRNKYKSNFILSIFTICSLCACVFFARYRLPLSLRSILYFLFLIFFHFFFSFVLDANFEIRFGTFILLSVTRQINILN